MTNSERKKGIGAAARVTALASSVMDLHVRIALQEMDREKRRLISGVIFLATGGVLMLFALLGFELILGFNAKISKNIFMGTSLRLNRMINQKSPENFGNLYIPGFNIVTEDNNFGTGITYTLTYRIPIVKK